MINHSGTAYSIYREIKKIYTSSVELEDAIGKRGKDSTFELDRIISLCRNLWHDALKPLRAHSFPYTVSNDGEEVSPWTVIMANKLQIENSNDNEDDSIIHYCDAQQSESLLETHLSIATFLRNTAGFDGSIRSCVWSIFCSVEEILYRLRKSDDEFLQKRRDLERSLGELYGLCIHLFMDNKNEYAIAYVMHKICKDILGLRYSPYGEDNYDLATKMAVDYFKMYNWNDIYYSFTLLDLIKLDKLLIIAAAKNDEIELLHARCRTLFFLIGRIYADDDNVKKLQEQVKKNGGFSIKQIKDLNNLLSTTAATASKKRADLNQDVVDRENSWNVLESAYSVYGHLSHHVNKEKALKVPKKASKT